VNDCRGFNLAIAAVNSTAPVKGSVAITNTALGPLETGVFFPRSSVGAAKIVPTTPGVLMIAFLRKAGLLLIAALFLTSGTCHFALTPFFMQIMPPYLPFHREAVYVSGALELFGAVGLLFPGSRKRAGKALFALTLAVTPANVHMWLHPELFPAFSPVLLFWRLPAQAILLAMIWFSAIAF
jgi:uncharacterized membrane protein